MNNKQTFLEWNVYSKTRENYEELIKILCSHGIASHYLSRVEKLYILAEQAEMAEYLAINDYAVKKFPHVEFYLSHPSNDAQSLKSTNYYDALCEAVKIVDMEGK